MRRSTERLPIVVKEPFGAVPELRPLRRDMYMAEVSVHMRPGTDTAAGVVVRGVRCSRYTWPRYFYSGRYISIVKEYMLGLAVISVPVGRTRRCAWASARHSLFTRRAWTGWLA
jgi:hypothetical protein